MSDPERIVAIDPGDHCGWALALRPGGVYDSGTSSPGEMFARLERWCMGVECDGVDTVLIEEYRIDDPRHHAGSDVPTLQVIGALRYIAARFAPEARVIISNRQVKRPTGAILKQRGIAPHARTDDVHARDAQLHAWAHILRAG